MGPWSWHRWLPLRSGAFALSPRREHAAAGSAALFEEIEAIRSFSDPEAVSEPGLAAASTAQADSRPRRMGTWNGRLSATIWRPLLERGRRLASLLMAERLSGSPDSTAAPSRPWGGPSPSSPPTTASPLADAGSSYNGKQQPGQWEDNRDGDTTTTAESRGGRPLPNDHADPPPCATHSAISWPPCLLRARGADAADGDEVCRRSQGGNNNTGAKNNPLVWMHWRPRCRRSGPASVFVQRLRCCAGKNSPPAQPGAAHVQRQAGPTHSSTTLWREWPASKWNAPRLGQLVAHLAWRPTQRRERGSSLALVRPETPTARRSTSALPKPSEAGCACRPPAQRPGPAPPPPSSDPAAGPAGEPAA